MLHSFRFGNDNYDVDTPNNYDGISSNYKSALKGNLNNMKEIAKQFDIVAKFSNVTDEFKNGGWVEAFATSEIKDPVAFAAHNDIKIEGKNPLQWAYKNDYIIKEYKESC